MLASLRRGRGWTPLAQRPRACSGTDDGTGTACALNDDSSACAVADGDCAFSAVAGVAEAEAPPAAAGGEGLGLPVVAAAFAAGVGARGRAWLPRLRKKPSSGLVTNMEMQAGIYGGDKASDEAF